MTVSKELEKEIDERITHYPVSKRSAVLPVRPALVQLVPRDHHLVAKMMTTLWMLTLKK